MHHSYYSRALLSCTTRTCAPLHNLVHYSYTTTYSRAPISCTTCTHAPIGCTTQNRALLVLVHHSVLFHHSALVHHSVLVHHSCTHLMHHSVISCTSPALLILLSCTTLVHHSYSCTTRTSPPLRNLVHYSCTIMYSREPISCTTRTHAPLVHHSVLSCTARATLRNLVHHSRAPIIKPTRCPTQEGSGPLPWQAHNIPVATVRFRPLANSTHQLEATLSVA